MNAFEVKIHLFKNGLTITAIAKDLAPAYGATIDSLRMMLTELFYHGKYNERLAAIVESEYGIKVDRPKRPQTVREAVQRAA